MKRKLVLVAIVLVVGVVVYNMFKTSEVEKEWVGNNVRASIIGDTACKKNTPPANSMVYIDVTGSMVPYFGSGMVNVVSAIKNLNFTSTDIFFLRSDKPQQGLVVDIIERARTNSDLNLRKMTTFHQFFRNASDSIIANPGRMVYLVTDGIMSLGRKDIDMSDVLNEMEGEIAESFKNNGNSIACAVLRYIGDFDGGYCNCKEVTKGYKGLRPYYIIALGNKEQVRWLELKSDAELGTPEAKLFINTHDYSGHKNSKLDLGDSVRIQNMNDPVHLLFELPDCLKDIDVSSIKFYNAGTQLDKQVKVENGRIMMDLSPKDYLVRDAGSTKVTVEMVVYDKVPEKWFNEWNCTDDTEGPDSISTFGLKTLINAIHNGLCPSDELLKVKFSYLLQ